MLVFEVSESSICLSGELPFCSFISGFRLLIPSDPTCFFCGFSHGQSLRFLLFLPIVYNLFSIMSLLTSSDSAYCWLFPLFDMVFVFEDHAFANDVTNTGEWVDGCSFANDSSWVENRVAADFDVVAKHGAKFL